MSSKTYKSKSSHRSFKPLLPQESSIQYFAPLSLDSPVQSHTKLSENLENNEKSSENLGIFIRIRPFLKQESEKRGDFLRVSPPSTLQITDSEHQTFRQWEFHEVFPENSTQKYVFSRTCAPMIDSVLRGFNASIFVYGQTGTGKTHTMGLLTRISENSEGLVPCSLRYLFKSLENKPRSSWEMSLSFYQLYLDEIHDLLNPFQGKSLIIKEDLENNEAYIKDLTTVCVENVSQALQLINAGLNFRYTRATKSNDTSSRSHVVLTVHLLRKEGKNTWFSKANFVDLAGSERMSTSPGKNNAKRLEETRFINSSLSTLGTIIANLNEKTENKHISYRNSKLTRILKSSLSGNSKVFLIATVNPLRENLQETVSTCSFAARCKELRVRPVSQNVFSESYGEIQRVVEYYESLVDSQKQIIRELEAEMQRIRRDDGFSQGNLEEIRDFNGYLCKLLLSLRTFVGSEAQKHRKTQGDPHVEENLAEFSAIFEGNDEDLQRKLEAIQLISKEIMQLITEIGQGWQVFEEQKRGKSKENSENKENFQKKDSYNHKNFESFYKIIAFLLKEVSICEKIQPTIESEALALEKLAAYKEKIATFMEKTHGKAEFHANFPDFQQKLDLFTRKSQSFSLEFLENKDFFLQTMHSLRKYSNNSFHEDPQPVFFVEKEQKIQGENSVNANVNSQESKNSITSHKSLKDLTFSKKQQRILAENEAISKEKSFRNEDKSLRNDEKSFKSYINDDTKEEKFDKSKPPLANPLIKNSTLAKASNLLESRGNNPNNPNSISSFPNKTSMISHSNINNNNHNTNIHTQIPETLDKSSKGQLVSVTAFQMPEKDQRKSTREEEDLSQNTQNTQKNPISHKKSQEIIETEPFDPTNSPQKTSTQPKLLINSQYELEKARLSSANNGNFPKSQRKISENDKKISLKQETKPEDVSLRPPIVENQRNGSLIMSETGSKTDDFFLNYLNNELK